MAALEAVALHLGVVFVDIAAGPVLRVLAPQSLYRVGAAGAAMATLILVPLLRLRHETTTEKGDAVLGDEHVDVAAERAMVDVVASSVRSNT